MSLVLLGATGSIGTQTLEVASRLGIEVIGLAARTASDRIVALAEAHPEAAVVVVGGALEERARLTGLLGSRVSFGAQAVDDLAAGAGRTVLNAMVGSAGLSATVAALGAGNRLALANKESLVAGGELVTAALAKGGGELIPVDSEHSAVLQCLAGEQADAVKRIILTASGGPFRGRTADQLAEVTPAEALRHPTWSMGRRITIDSATLINKGLEVIEAHVLFGVDYDRIDVRGPPREHRPRHGRVRRRLGEGAYRGAGHEGAHPVRPDPSGAASGAGGPARPRRAEPHLRAARPSPPSPP